MDPVNYHKACKRILTCLVSDSRYGSFINVVQTDRITKTFEDRMPEVISRFNLIEK